MDDMMDYSYHHSEQHPNHAQLPYAQQLRCPYLNRPETTGQTASSPHRSHYDPVHASAHNWQPPVHLPPQYWQSSVLGRTTSSPYHVPAGSIPEPAYYNTMPSLRQAAPQGPPHDIGGIQALHPPFSVSQLPPMQFGAIPTIAPSRSQPSMATAEIPVPPALSHHNNHFGTLTPQMASTPPASARHSAEPGGESPSATEPPASEFTPASTQAPPATSSNMQFGSAPSSLSSQLNNDGPFVYRSHRPTPDGEELAVTSTVAPFPSFSHAVPGSGSASSTSMNSQASAAPPAERRRVEAPPLRRLPRRSSPPSDPYDQEGDFPFLEHIMGSMGRDVDDNHIRNVQLMRGSLTTKMVASVTAIDSLQSVAISDLSESERSCVICYNDFGVETPEGVKEAPLRLPKCRHIFGDHCIKKWFEESNSCPYCRDKLPSELRMTSSTNDYLARMMYLQRLSRERELRGNAGQDDSSRTFALASDRRSPPTDGGDSRRRIRPRHGSGGRGTGSPPFSLSRPGSFGGSSTIHERRPHALTTSRTYALNASNRVHGGGPFAASFSSGHLSQYHISGVGGPADATSSSGPVITPSPFPTVMPDGTPQTGQSAGIPNPVNRNSLPASPPGSWHSRFPTILNDE